jgi:hypothetical protein
MDHRPVADWLKKRAAADAALSFLSGAMILAVGFVVVVVCFGTAWVLVWLVSRLGMTAIGPLLFDQPTSVPAEVNVISAAALVGVLFFVNRRLRHEYSRPPRRHLTREEIEKHSPEELVHLLAYPGASNHPFSDFLFTGPRLLGIGFDHIRKAERLWRLDVERCSLLLCLLASRPARVSLLELTSAGGVPDLGIVLPQMADINGVLILQSEPPGLGLTSELRRELKDLAWTSERSDLDGRPDTGLHPASADPDDFAELGRTISLEEFERAYRRRLRERARTGAPGSQPADQNAEAVKAAYQAFLERQARQPSDRRDQKVERVWARYKQTKN